MLRIEAYIEAVPAHLDSWAFWSTFVTTYLGKTFECVYLDRYLFSGHAGSLYSILLVKLNLHAFVKVIPGHLFPKLLRQRHSFPNMSLSQIIRYT